MITNKDSLMRNIGKQQILLDGVFANFISTSKSPKNSLSICHFIFLTAVAPTCFFNHFKNIVKCLSTFTLVSFHDSIKLFNRVDILVSIDNRRGIIFYGQTILIKNSFNRNCGFISGNQVCSISLITSNISYTIFLPCKQLCLSLLS